VYPLPVGCGLGVYLTAGAGLDQSTSAPAGTVRLPMIAAGLDAAVAATLSAGSAVFQTGIAGVEDAF
jgi:hypothetical protein